jgi:hypothetical protein
MVNGDRQARPQGGLLVVKRFGLLDGQVMDCLYIDAGIARVE